MQLENMRCRNCGAELDIQKGVNGVVQCEYCMSKFTLPKEDITPAALKFLHDGESSLYVCRFDDAYAFYKKAAELSPAEPEAYWGMAISQFKVQYIKDEVNDRLQPVCHLMSTENIRDNANYKRAVSLATSDQRTEYEKQAAEIDYIREEFYKLKQTGKEYDCFICVKVTDDNTKQRTADYKHADDIYFDLKGKGYNPFFSERELGDVTGADYEARILYALYTSECMIVVCGKEEYLHTKWVKNEYTRFLRLVGDEEKESDSITIAFDGRPVEYLPGKNGKIQGIDLRSLNASEKITRFVENHTPEARARKAQEEQARRESENAILRQIEQRLNNIGSAPAAKKSGEKRVSVKSLIMRADAFLADKDFVSAESYYNKALDTEPENGAAWLGLLLVQNRVETLDGLLKLDDDSLENAVSKKSFQLAQKYAVDDTLKEINSFLEKLEDRREIRRREEARILKQKEDEERARQSKEKEYEEQEAAAASARDEYAEASKLLTDFVNKHSLGGWGSLISLLAAGGFVLLCTLTDVLTSWGATASVITWVCIIGFVVVYFIVHTLLILIVDSLLQARHKEERNALKVRKEAAKSRLVEEETKYLNMWCDANKCSLYYVNLLEAVKYPSAAQKKIIKKHTGYDDNSVNRILNKASYSDYIKKAFAREEAIGFVIELELEGIKVVLGKAGN